MIDDAGARRSLLVLNPNTSGSVTELIDQRVRRALPPGWSAETRRVAWGTPSVESSIDMAIAGLAVADGVLGSSADGVLVAAFGDPGLAAARELAGVPVVGIGEAATLLAAESGPFAVLTIQPASVPTVRQMLRSNAVEGLCRRLVALPLPVLAAAEPDSIRELLRESALAIAEDPEVRTIVLGGGPLGVHAEWLAEACGVPAIDPIAAGIARLVRFVQDGEGASAPPVLGAKTFSGGYDFLERIAGRIRPVERR